MLIDMNIGKNAEYTLTYEIFDNRVANKIWEWWKPGANNYDFVSRSQFYGWGETEEDIQAKLDESIENIKRLKPELFVNGVDLNRLHETFPDNVHGATGELRHWLSMFNYHLHHLEGAQRTEFGRHKIILFATDFGEPQPEPLELSDYELFTSDKRQDYLYMNYPHVGKHIQELYADNDVDVPAEHIVPTHIVKSDLKAYFGPDKIKDNGYYKRVRRWCGQIAHKLPYPPDDIRLAIGYIPIGKLAHTADFDMISQNQYLHSVESR
jgi:hypothetical protein